MIEQRIKELQAHKELLASLYNKPLTRAERRKIIRDFKKKNK